MKNVDCFSNYERIIKALNGGAFLTVKDRVDKVNTMTIAWATLGIVWRVPVFMVMVRPSRYTFELIENADDFTITFPFSDMKEQLEFCGTHSGRALDKYKECNLNIVPAQKVKSPIIEVASGRHYECKIVQATPLDKAKLDQSINVANYGDNSYHTYYFGEVVACYDT